MGLFELCVVAIGLSMDAFAVSICIGLSHEKAGFGKSLTAGLYFGVFQMLMPLIGFFLGSRFADMITAYDHWIAFLLLAVIGGKMVVESFSKEACNRAAVSMKFTNMLTLAVATSIDALAMGISFAFLKVNIIFAVVCIGLTTLVFSMAGVKIGNIFGTRFKSKAEFAGGIILILVGFKILFDHLRELA